MPLSRGRFKGIGRKPLQQMCLDGRQRGKNGLLPGSPSPSALVLRPADGLLSPANHLDEKLLDEQLCTQQSWR